MYLKMSQVGYKPNKLSLLRTQYCFYAHSQNGDTPVIVMVG